MLEDLAWHGDTGERREDAAETDRDDVRQPSRQRMSSPCRSTRYIILFQKTVFLDAGVETCRLWGSSVPEKQPDAVGTLAPVAFAAAALDQIFIGERSFEMRSEVVELERRGVPRNQVSPMSRNNR